MRDYLPLIFMVALIAFAIWWEYGLWDECLNDHSFFYCLRVLGR